MQLVAIARTHRCIPSSIKNSTREKQGKGSQLFREITSENKLPGKWDNFYVINKSCLQGQRKVVNSRGLNCQQENLILANRIKSHLATFLRIQLRSTVGYNPTENEYLKTYKHAVHTQLLQCLHEHICANLIHLYLCVLTRQ